MSTLNSIFKDISTLCNLNALLQMNHEIMIGSSETKHFHNDLQMTCPLYFLELHPIGQIR